MEEEISIHTKSIVKLQPKEGLRVFLLNAFLPGVGTVYAGCKVRRVLANNIMVGFLQAITSLLLVGWLWSLLTGYLIWNESK